MAHQGAALTKMRKPGCLPCRDRHLRCDRDVPSCSACRRSRQPRRCEYAGAALRVRPSVYTERVRVRGRASNSQASDDTAVRAEAADEADEADEADARSTTTIAVSSISSPRVDRDRATDAVSTSRAQQQTSLVPRLSRWSPIVSLPRHVVANPGDAELFEFYIRETGVWLDIVSPTCFFSETVPRLALHDPVLFSACLSYAARIRALTGALDPAQGELYGSRAIEALLSTLSSRSRSDNGDNDNDVLCAAVVILRMAEQFSEMQEDMQCHLMGASSLFARNPDHALDFDDAVAFWVYKRQSIRMAVLNEEPCEMEEMDVDVDVDVDVDRQWLAPVSDEAWANRATYLFARACSVCWDATLADAARAARLLELHRLLAQWHERVPATYQPWARYQAPDDPFPTLRYVSTWHVVGWQYYYGAKVLVALHRRPQDTNTTNTDTTTPANMLALGRYMEAEVLEPTRVLCGITMASPAFGATINGTAIIAWLGQVFSHRDDQTRLLTFLQDFMQRTKWPNATCCDKLQRIWSGEAQSWVQ
ncbi:hypothetical protein HMPREF1624_06912 [Sporothrix schenckii ATCC 58251]|uniref:Zn(2)-C6 fungal-type domain-containing protein n=1 Tax=Sporothrix schenckii (strain ATCC 58251 / de Perez 2211183) TaxID=1391915 RepID=U7PM25_SPOS1|nr:hypothetical protein HMPREF1624_06912 [Sporothrix schenckii ATCC 58251]